MNIIDYNLVCDIIDIRKQKVVRMDGLMNYKKNYLCIIYIFMFLCIFSGCSVNSSSHGSEYPLTLNNVTFKKSPKRVVVLSDSLADIILTISQEINLVGRSSECTQEELEVLPDVGSENSLDVEKIQSLFPDLILYNKNFSDETLNSLKKRLKKVDILVLPDAKTRTELVNLYSDLGSLFGGKCTGSKKSEKIVKKLIIDIDDLSRNVSLENKHITVCYLFDENGAIATEDTFLGKLMESIGCFNISGDAKNNFIDIENVILSNPMFIFCDKGVEKKLRSNKKFWGLSAISEHKIFELDKNTVGRQGKSLLKFVKFMHEKIYKKINIKMH